MIMLDEIVEDDMGNFTFYDNYVFEKPRREQLYHFFERVFHTPVQTLQKFYDKEFLNHTYDSLAYVEEDTVIANASIFSLPMLVNGTYIKATGIQCTTLELEHCKTEIIKQLFHNVLEKVNGKHEHVLLFTKNPELYTSFGFKVVPQQLLNISYEKKAVEESSLRKLDCSVEEDLHLIQEVLEESQSLSRKFSALNYQILSCLNMHSNKWNNKLYYSKKLETVIVYEVVDRVLKLYGVYASVIPVLDELCEEMVEEFSEIEFYFYPDQLGIENVGMTEYLPTEFLMVRGANFSDLSGYKYPILAEF